MYYTYILVNKQTKRYYIGFSPDLRKRFQKHKDGKVKSTKSNLNYQLMWYCAFVFKRDALEFERYLKSGSGIAFMKKRFLKSFSEALVKWGDLVLRSLGVGWTPLRSTRHNSAPGSARYSIVLGFARRQKQNLTQAGAIVAALFV